MAVPLNDAEILLKSWRITTSDAAMMPICISIMLAVVPGIVSPNSLLATTFPEEIWDELRTSWVLVLLQSWYGHDYQTSNSTCVMSVKSSVKSELQGVRNLHQA